MNPKLILIILSIILAGLSYAWSPLLGASVIILGGSHLVP